MRWPCQRSTTLLGRICSSCKPAARVSPSRTTWPLTITRRWSARSACTRPDQANDGTVARVASLRLAQARTGPCSAGAGAMGCGWASAGAAMPARGREAGGNGNGSGSGNTAVVATGGPWPSGGCTGAGFADGNGCAGGTACTATGWSGMTSGASGRGAGACCNTMGGLAGKAAVVGATGCTPPLPSHQATVSAATSSRPAPDHNTGVMAPRSSACASDGAAPDGAMAGW